MRFCLLLLQVMLFLFFKISAKAETVEVEIFKSTFIPAVLKVEKGDTVRWVNKDEVLHTVTSGKSHIQDEKFNANF